MAFRVVGANSRRTKIELELPIDDNGDYAFDEDEEPVKGREPITIVLPRFNYLPVDELKALQANVTEVEERELDDVFTASDRSREVALATLRPFVTEKQAAALNMLSLGELEQISGEWSRQSATPLGESSASNGSSKSTRRPSSTTSSAPASASAT